MAKCSQRWELGHEHTGHSQLHSLCFCAFDIFHNKIMNRILSTFFPGSVISLSQERKSNSWMRNSLGRRTISQRQQTRQQENPHAGQGGIVLRQPVFIEHLLCSECNISSFSPDHDPTSRSYEYAHFIDKEIKATEDEVACSSHVDGNSTFFRLVC